MATTTLPQSAPNVPSRDDLVLRAYGALLLAPGSRPDLIAYVFVAGETPAFGLQEASSHLADNFPTFAPLSVSAPCPDHSILWFADVAEARRFGKIPWSRLVSQLPCPYCTKTGAPLTMLNQGRSDG